MSSSWTSPSVQSPQTHPRCSSYVLSLFVSPCTPFLLHPYNLGINANLGKQENHYGLMVLGDCEAEWVPLTRAIQSTSTNHHHSYVRSAKRQCPGAPIPRLFIHPATHNCQDMACRPSCCPSNLPLPPQHGQCATSTESLPCHSS